MTFFINLEQIISKICMETQNIQTTYTIEQENKSWSIMFLDFKMYFQATVIKIAWK